jgi:hypothetical protein
MSGANVFSLEEQMRLAREGVRVRGASRPARLSRRYAAALEELAAAEAKLGRAATRWQKARKAVRRLERELDHLPAELGE